MGSEACRRRLVGTLRPMTAAAILKKFAFVIAVVVLFIMGRVPSTAFIFGGIDLVMGIVFIAAWLLMPDIKEETVDYAPPQ
jgi:hypothetical protein